MSQIKFKEGSAVKAGDELILLDNAIEKAQLRAAEATAELALLNHKRSRELLASRSISQ